MSCKNLLTMTTVAAVVGIALAAAPQAEAGGLVVAPKVVVRPNLGPAYPVTPGYPMYRPNYPVISGYPVYRSNYPVYPVNPVICPHYHVMFRASPFEPFRLYGTYGSHSLAHEVVDGLQLAGFPAYVVHH